MKALSVVQKPTKEAAVWDAIDATEKSDTGAPPEARTVDECQEAWGLAARETTRNRIDKLVKAGVLCVGRASRKLSDGRTMTLCVYWPKAKEN